MVTKWLPSVHQLVTKWSPNGYQVVVKAWTFDNLSTVKHILMVLDDTETLQPKKKLYKT